MVFAEVIAALRWWLILAVLGAAAFPITFTIFARLPDRGYAFARPVGLLLVGYLFWIVSSLGFLGNNAGAVLVSTAVVAAAAYWLYHRQRNASGVDGEASINQWLDGNRRQVLLTELVFAVLFAVWVWVRAQNPAIAATEKPMEFAFLNALGRSPSFPPLDPWLSGYAISYYYFGYVMTSVVARLAMVPEHIAFNLAIAWLVAGTGTGAFGLVYNMLRTQGAGRSARLLGLVAALAVPLAGNLEVGLEVAHANGIGSPGFWQWLDVRDLNTPAVIDSPMRYETSAWWWWRSSRPLREYYLSGRAEDGLEPIAEFPAFSFVLGNLHPHVLALPFALLSLAVAFAWWLPRERAPDFLASWSVTGWSGRIRALIHHIGAPMWIFSAVVLGGLAFLNTWDVLIHLFIILGAFALSRWRDSRSLDHVLSQTAATALLLIVPLVLLYLPFLIGFRSQAAAPYLLPMLMRPTRLVQFLIIFGMPLWAVIIFMLALVIRQRFRYWQTGLAVAAGLVAALLLLALLFGFIVASSADGASRLTDLANELGVSLPGRPDQPLAPGWGIAGIGAILPAYLQARFAYPALTLMLAAIVGMAAMIWREQLGRDPRLWRQLKIRAR